MAGRPEGCENAGPVFFSRQVVGGVPWTILSKLFIFFVYLGVPIITVRMLGAEKYGVFALCRTISEFLAIVCALGFNTALIRFVPELCATQNRAGLVRLLNKVAWLQIGTIVIATLGLYAGKPYFDSWFRIDFHHLLLFTALLIAAQLMKGFIVDAFTALFHIRAVSIMSMVQALLWFGVIAIALPRVPEVHMALLAMALPILLVFMGGILLLVRFIRRLQWRSPAYGIGKRRILGIALPSVLNSITGLILNQYSELFFLGIFFTPTMVGLYELGCGVPFLVITFLPFTLQNLFTSGFAEAYAKDQNCLERLVSSYYKALIVTILPFSALGVFFAPRAVEVIYGAQMKAAGPIAAMFFFIHSLSLFSAPLSMAVVTKEKVLHTQPLLILQVVVNLILDYTLIRRYGMNGGVAAVLGTFLLTIPVRLYVVAKLIGGVYFPMRFFLKVAVSVFVLATVLWLLAPNLGLIGLFAVGLVYGAAYLAAIRFLRLIQERDITELRNLGFGKLNRILDLLVGSAHA